MPLNFGAAVEYDHARPLRLETADKDGPAAPLSLGTTVKTNQSGQLNPGLQCTF